MLLTHGPILETAALHWPDEAACAAWAARMARHAQLHNAYIELHGPLGAGKTTYVRHLLRALGVAGRIKSPTYAVLEPYTVGTPDGLLEISHFDFYRFNDAHEWEDAGFRDVFGRPGLKLAEWPEKAAGMLPLADLRLSIEVGDTSNMNGMTDVDDMGGTRSASPRHVHAEAFTPVGRSLLT